MRLSKYIVILFINLAPIISVLWRIIFLSTDWTQPLLDFLKNFFPYYENLKMKIMPF